jgi:hypothetical protein
MNERIKQLAEQAGFTVENGHIQSLAYKQTEKLAELIVRECARVADESLNIITMKPEWPSKYIKEHFGVEE